MKCPLFRLAVLANPRGKDGILTDCLEEKCAWWDESIECCCIVKSLLCELASLSELAAEIKEKLPYKADLPK